MLKALTRKFFGSPSEKFLKDSQGLVRQINALELRFEALSDDELKSQTQLFRDRLAQGETLDELLPEAFAVAREACKRALGMRPFDVQLLGGMVLHKGRIVEMKTGE